MTVCVWKNSQIKIKQPLDTEDKQLDEVLKVQSFDNQNKINKPENMVHINTNITPMGRPINVNQYQKWKPTLIQEHEELFQENKTESYEKNTEELYVSIKL
jgi:hypothetical protein